MKVMSYFLLLLFVAMPAYAGHMKLLAVSQIGDSLVGSQADLFLDVKEGSGRVFIETFPITKMDTQISTRFAKEIATSMTSFIQ
jgi:predicted S18 family serine protease